MEGGGLKSLETRRQLLAMQCEVHRQIFRQQMAGLRSKGAVAGKTLDTLRNFRPAFLMAAPIAGFFLARRWPALKGMATRGLLGWAVFRRAGKVLSSLTRK